MHLQRRKDKVIEQMIRKCRAPSRYSAIQDEKRHTARNEKHQADTDRSELVVSITPAAI
jgi:hypothetical protein